MAHSGYFDCNATTPPHPEVRAGIVDALNAWGNPSSIHAQGRAPKIIMRETRQALARALNVSPLEIVFSSGASESNTTVIMAAALAGQKAGREVLITSMVEHPSVAKTFDHLSEMGFQVLRLKVSGQGEIDLDQYRIWLQDFASEIALVSVMAANNETGHLFPVKKMAAAAHEVGALFHSDCVQVFGKMQLHPSKWGLDYATFSAHKFYALKGTGFCFVRKGAPYEPLIYGGGQERHRRGGTENSLGIWALGVMAKFLDQVEAQEERVRALRDRFESNILARLPNVRVTGPNSKRLPNTSSLILDGVDGETLLMNLDIKGFCVSTGAACSSGSPEPSPVLRAMGLSLQEAQNSLRVSLGWETTEEDLARFEDVLVETVHRLRDLQRTMEVENGL